MGSRSSVRFPSVPCAAGAPGSNRAGVRSGERRPACNQRLEPEDLLDLVPAGQEKEQGQPGENGEGEEEAQPCVRLLALATNARVPPSAVVVVRAVDRPGIDRRFFCWLDNVSSRWLGHRWESIGAEAPTRRRRVEAVRAWPARPSFGADSAAPRRGRAGLARSAVFPRH